jgi:uncharacterized protein YutE (UPF0331/DUF86 family)
LDARLRRIVESVQALRLKRALAYDAFARDRDTLLAAERGLQLAIGAALEVGADLVAKHFPKMPASNRQIFCYMGECGILPPEFARRISPMAGMRNVLVHVYLQVDPRKLYDVLRTSLDDVDEYVVRVSSFISSFIERHEAE